MNPTNVVAAAASSSSSNDDDANGASSGNVISNVASGEQVIPELPLHLTEKILHCISPLESAHLATVCKSWAAIISKRLAIPVLFVRPPLSHRDHNGVVVSVPLEGAVGRSRLPPAAIPADVRTHGKYCSSDAAFVSSDHDYELVQLRWKAAGGEWTHRTLAPSGVAMSPMEFIHSILAVVKCNGCFYMLHHGGRYVSMVDITVPPPLSMKTMEVPGLVDEQRRYFRAELGHLVESHGEVLYVRRLIQYKDIDPASPAFCEHNNLDLVIVGFEVYRLDVEGRCWVRVERLDGDQALFVSQESSFAVRASETEGCRSNCIYFVRKIRYCVRCLTVSWHVWGAYSLDHQEVLFEQPFIETGRCESGSVVLA